jgi:hypothetical protein
MSESSSLIIDDDRQTGSHSAPVESAEYLACSADPAYFIDNYGVIDNRQQDSLADVTGGTTRFKLWPSQTRFLWEMHPGRLVCILKARQLGISWLLCAYALWLCLFNPGYKVLLFSKRQDEANDLLRRIRSLYQRLPGWFRSRLPTIGIVEDAAMMTARSRGRRKKRILKENTRELEFSNGSRILSMPATPSAGVSYTADLVIMDEAAHMPNGRDLAANVKPTIDAGGRLIVLSTANGMGDFFHDFWTDSVTGKNGFKAFFLPWWARPDRDAAWYERVRKESPDSRKFLQNYPSNPIEAFASSGACRFDPEWVIPQTANLRDGIPPEQWPPSLLKRGRWGLDHVEDLPATLKDVPGLTVYAPPIEGRKYVVASDVAEGVEGGDYSCSVVLDEETWEEMAVLHGNWEPDSFARYTMALTEPYNEATSIVERNNHGHAVLLAMKLLEFPRIGIGCDGSPGWPTNEKTKAIGMDLLAACLRDSLIKIRCHADLIEIQIYKRLKDGKTGAPPGKNDDRVMMWYVGLSFIRHSYQISQAQWSPTAGGDIVEVAGIPRL